MLLNGQKLSGFVSQANMVSKPLLGYRLVFVDKSSLSLWETRCPPAHNTGLKAVPLATTTAVRKITSPMKQMLGEVSGVLPHYC